jgi:hypothetical protein
MKSLGLGAQKLNKIILNYTQRDWLVRLNGVFKTGALSHRVRSALLTQNNHQEPYLLISK